MKQHDAMHSSFSNVQQKLRFTHWTLASLLLQMLPLVAQQCRTSNISKDSGKTTLIPSLVRTSNEDCMLWRARLLELETQCSILREQLDMSSADLERERLKASSLLKQNTKHLEKITRQEREDENSLQHYLSDYISTKFKIDTLFTAVRRGDVPVMRQLIRAGLNASVVDHKNRRRTLLHWAVVKGRAAMTKALIEDGADIEAREAETMQTPLHLAAYLGHNEVAKILLNNGAIVDARSAYKRTALHWAAVKGHLEMAKILVRHGADPLAKDNFRNTPYAVALRGNHTELAGWLDRAEIGDVSLEDGRPLNP